MTPNYGELKAMLERIIDSHKGTGKVDPALITEAADMIARKATPKPEVMMRGTASPVFRELANDPADW
tara:strand:+ start:644 stop:847 length:204 start_codon:yes stop_codon:yes gene_type:complete